MEDINLYTASSTKNKSSYQKKYKCPYCEKKFERHKLPTHIQRVHEDLIPQGYTATRVAFNTINKKDHGTCIICGKESDWNEAKGRYNRLCNDPKCKEAYKEMAAKRNRNKYGTDRLQTDPRYAEEVQKKALAGRGISGEYTFEDKGKLPYVGSYEKQLLEFMDQVMHCLSEDIVAPGPSFEYMWEGKSHIYISDFYYTPYNLIIEVKDGGDNPNKNPAMQKYKTDRQAAKEDAVRKTNKFNYVRLTNNDFGQLMSIMGLLKYNLLNDCTDIVMRINEASLMKEDMSGTIGAALPPTPSPMPYESDKNNYYIIQHPKNNVFSYSITHDPLQYTMYSVDPLDKKYYKVYKTDKGKINKNYLTFEIKDKKTAKELYDELAKLDGKSFVSDICESDNYIYEYLTNGSKILSEDQLIFDDRFKLVKDFNTQLDEDCNNLYNWLKGTDTSGVDLLESQVKDLENTIYGNVDISYENQCKLKELSSQLEYCDIHNIERRNELKNEIRKLNWNSEIPFSESSYIKMKKYKNRTDNLNESQSIIETVFNIAKEELM